MREMECTIRQRSFQNEHWRNIQAVPAVHAIQVHRTTSRGVLNMTCTQRQPNHDMFLWDSLRIQRAPEMMPTDQVGMKHSRQCLLTQ